MKIITLLLPLIVSIKTFANCQITNSKGIPITGNQDLLSLSLAQLSSCPKDVFELKKIWLNSGFTIKAAMVANRGRNNPQFGSFSFFETVEGISKQNSFQVNSGELFFGHFTGKHLGEVVLDQTNSTNKLMIELIAWDYNKKYFNFYELIGTNTSSQWFYRGDSIDILDDNKMIYLADQPRFGNKLRCSACHSSGGPIMKELQAPHNDWWTSKRSLEFSPNKASDQVKFWLKDLQPAESFSMAVKRGIHQLEKSIPFQNYKSSQSLQTQLRPLFCEMEINLESDANTAGNFLQIPQGFAISPLFGINTLTFPKSQYQNLLAKYKMKFPETGFSDSDHPWLTPVKSYSDLLSIQNLIQKGVIDIKFALDVLSVDARNPIFSKDRCQLIRLVPNGGNWQQTLLQRLQSSQLPAAKILLENLTNPNKNAKWYQNQTQIYIQQLQKMILSSGEPLFINLIKAREAALASEISKNPLGQILEPGFRVIFPLPYQQ